MAGRHAAVSRAGAVSPNRAEPRPEHAAEAATAQPGTAGPGTPPGRASPRTTTDAGPAAADVRRSPSSSRVLSWHTVRHGHRTAVVRPPTVPPVDAPEEHL